MFKGRVDKWPGRCVAGSAAVARRETRRRDRRARFWHAQKQKMSIYASLLGHRVLQLPLSHSF